MRKSVPAFTAVLLLTAATAAQATPYFRPYIEGGGEFGGDTFGTVFFAGGGTQDITTGDGIWISGGLNFRPSAESRFGLRTGVGYKYVTTQASNVDINISRVTFQAMPYFRFSEGFWGSAGLVKHANVKFNGGGLIPDEDLDASLGGRVELGWRFLGLSYTNLEYTDRLNNKYDSSSFGIFATSAFGGRCCRKAAPPKPAAAYVPPSPPPTNSAPVETAAAPAPVASAPVAPVEQPVPLVQEAPAPVVAAAPAAPAYYPPVSGSAGFAREGAMLRATPSTKGRVLVALPTGAIVSRLSTLKTSTGTWWQADVDGYGSGWLLDTEVRN